MNRFMMLLFCLALLAAGPTLPLFGEEETEEDRAFLGETIQGAYHGRYRTAVRDLEDYLADFPDSVRALQGLNWTERMRGRYAEALTAAEAWLDKAGDGANTDALIALGRTLALLGRYEDALDAFRKALNGDLSSLEARTRLCEFLHGIGRREEAIELAKDSIRLARSSELDGDGYCALSRLFHLIGDLERAAQAAVAADFRYNGKLGENYRYERIEALLVLCELYRKTRIGGTGSGTRAVACYRDALKINPNHPEALLGLARTRFYAFKFEAALKQLDRALLFDPVHAGVLAFKAHILTLTRRYDEAWKLVERGLKVNPRHKGLLAQKAALLLFKGDFAASEQLLAKALETDSQFGEAFFRIGELLIYHYRFSDAETSIRRCLEIDPDYSEAYILLARTLANLGQEEEARKALLESAERDPYDYPWRNNMLKVFSTLDGFARMKSDLLDLALNEKEAEVMRPYLLQLARESYEQLESRYGFKASAPILMEMFPDYNDFAVRTVGFTGLGALGACFGEVVTLLSPRAVPFRGRFSWSSTVHHELAHVFTLQMSRYRIPRWLTEGISVFEEEIRNPWWRRNMDMELFNAFHNGKLFELERFDSGFMGPRVLLAYYHAGLTVKFIVDRFGMEKLCEMIRAYGEDLDTAQVIEKVFGMAPETFEKDSRDWIWSRLFAQVKCRPFYDPDKRRELVDEANREPMDFGKLLEAAWACFRNDKPVDALHFLHKAEQIRSDDGRALLLKAELALKKKNEERAERLFHEAVAAGVEDLFAYRSLGLMARKRGDIDEAIDFLQKAKACFPSYIGVFSPRLTLMELFQSEGREEEALEEMKGLLEQGLQDLDLILKLGDHYAEGSDYLEAVRCYESALAMDPFRRNIHVTLAQALYHLSKHARALDELDVALVVEEELDPKIPDHFMELMPLKRPSFSEADIHAERGANLLALGEEKEALAAAEKALDLEPGHEKAAALREKILHESGE